MTHQKAKDIVGCLFNVNDIFEGSLKWKILMNKIKVNPTHKPKKSVLLKTSTN